MNTIDKFKIFCGLSTKILAFPADCCWRKHGQRWNENAAVVNKRAFFERVMNGW